MCGVVTATATVTESAHADGSEAGPDARVAVVVLRLDGRPGVWRDRGALTDPCVDAWVSAVLAGPSGYASLSWAELRGLRLARRC
jgi:hypothetical protein